jgi:hypothetical protein
VIKRNDLIQERRKVRNCKICCTGQQKEEEEEGVEQMHVVCFEILERGRRRLGEQVGVGAEDDTIK